MFVDNLATKAEELSHMEVNMKCKRIDAAMVSRRILT